MSNILPEEWDLIATKGLDEFYDNNITKPPYLTLRMRFKILSRFTQGFFGREHITIWDRKYGKVNNEEMFQFLKSMIPKSNLPVSVGDIFNVADGLWRFEKDSKLVGYYEGIVELLIQYIKCIETDKLGEVLTTQTKKWACLFPQDEIDRRISETKKYEEAKRFMDYFYCYPSKAVSPSKYSPPHLLIAEQKRKVDSLKAGFLKKSKVNVVKDKRRI